MRNRKPWPLEEYQRGLRLRARVSGTLDLEAVAFTTVKA